MERNQGDEHGRLGKYELLERLGRGGMGEVWKARDTLLQRYVAIKLLRVELQNDPDFTASFMREAQLVAALRHPNIVQIHDFQSGGAQGKGVQAYMVMDYIKGGTLASTMSETVHKGVFWSPNDIVELFAAISRALDYAHEQGMIHRDIKPENILLDRSLSTAHMLGTPVLTDFGIARWQGGSSTLTGFVGTPLYMSPEQAQSSRVDMRSDLYSLGIVLYEVLTGVTPFRGDNPLSVIFQHVGEQPPPPASINPLVSPALSSVVLQSIAKDPRARFSSATTMTIALAQAFNLPVPALLRGLDAQHAFSTDYHQSQPHSGVTPESSSFALSASSPFFTPVAENQPEPLALFTSPAQEVNGMAPTAGETARQTPATTFSIAPVQPTVDAFRLLGSTPPVLLSQPIARRQSGPFLGKWLLISLSCLALLLLGLSAVVIVPRLSSPTGTSIPIANGGVVGQILFLSNSSVTKGTFNKVQIDLSNVPVPPAGKVYYAWLMQTDSEAVTIPHWPLQVINDAIHTLYTSASPQTNLLMGSNLFLITAEAISNSPVIPFPSPAQHYYYAPITQATTSLTFMVKKCPTSDINSATNPCR